MRGLEAEFERFTEQALGELPPGDLAGARRIFMCGALAQTNRIWSVAVSGLPDKRKMAIFRRIVRECERFMQEASEDAKNG